MIRAKLEDLEVLVDFGTPVISTGVLPSQFQVTGAPVVGVTFSGDQYCRLALGKTPPAGDLWLTYEATSGFAQVLRTAGTAGAVLSFEVLITELSAPEAQTYALSNTEGLPTLGDFIEAYSLREAIEITNSGDATATQPDELKFIRAMEDAEALWNSEVLAASMTSQLLLFPGKRRALLAIARYLLDQSGCPRPHVIAAYQEVLRNIRSTTAGGSPGAYTGDDDFFYYGVQPCCGARPQEEIYG
jgi:hypothetical protein